MELVHLDGAVDLTRAENQKPQRVPLRDFAADYDGVIYYSVARTDLGSAVGPQRPPSGL
jgi:hypothetical protein